MKKIMDERRSGKCVPFLEGESDLLDVFLNNEYFVGKDEEVMQEFIGNLFAGQDTINTTVANTIYYLTQNKGCLEKVIAEITPVMESTREDYRKLLNMDEVENFYYTKRCSYEAMRMDNPASSTGVGYFTKKVKVAGVELTPDIYSQVNIRAVSNDPK
jgi:cytochrome P450